MSTTRRDFVMQLALLAAGAAALPSQVRAFTAYYEANTPQGVGPFAAVDEIYLSGLSSRSTVLRMNIYRGESLLMPLAINSFGGQILWRAAPDNKIVDVFKNIGWKMECLTTDDHDLDRWLRNNAIGHISYIGQDMVRTTRIIDRFSGTLAG